MSFFSKINKFSQNVIKILFLSSLFLMASGIILLKNYTFYTELYIARKIAETGVCFLPLGVGLGFLTDYLYKRTVS